MPFKLASFTFLTWHFACSCWWTWVSDATADNKPTQELQNVLVTCYLLLVRWWADKAKLLMPISLPELVQSVLELVHRRSFHSIFTLWAYYNCDTSTIRVRFEYDSRAIQHPTRSYVLSSNNEQWTCQFFRIVVGCCSQSAIPRRNFYLYNDVIVTYTVFTCVWRVCSKSIVAAKSTHHEH